LIGKGLRLLCLTGAFLSVIIPGVLSHVDRLRLARSLRHMTMIERKTALLAPWYGQSLALRTAVPEEGAVDFVMARPAARDFAVLAGAVMHPRDVRFFDGWPAWRERRRADFVHDARAVNAAPGPAPGAAAVVVLIDPEATPQFRVITAAK
jgi:hypothetical protein